MTILFSLSLSLSCVGVCMCVCAQVCVMLSCFSHVWLFATLWLVARQASLSMEFSSQVYWHGFPCLPPVDVHDPGIKPVSLTSPALAGVSSTTSTAWEAPSQTRKRKRERQSPGCRMAQGKAQNQPIRKQKSLWKEEENVVYARGYPCHKCFKKNHWSLPDVTLLLHHSTSWHGLV